MFYSRSSPLPRVRKVGEMNRGARSRPRGVEWWLVEREETERRVSKVSLHEESQKPSVLQEKKEMKDEISDSTNHFVHRC